ncbi:LysR family transcriptional regulator [Streptomyces sp. DSM 42041]|uniref:LysR family transcriptional regulator n=1 Tax=Streptomyces hazeniae TaxID=3075538 RepID=A0ABU2NTJ0_9ACTN|nr:LysR family transcriptional regulator [Streptomyces sp. DSM 42041]MDT0380311.1 LysR family transcriptional regulator [Streptomyces sp. DSM 42041]
MTIDPRRLRVLRALADHGTVTAAAQALYLSPSAVSQQLAALETEAGQPLLERHGRNVRLTAPGAVLAAHATTIAAQLERAEADLAACAAGLVGEVVLAAYPTAITEIVAPAVAVLRRRTPQVAFQVKDAEGHASLRLLSDGDADVAVAVEHRETLGDGGASGDGRLLREPLYAEPFDAVLPPGHRLLGADRVPLTELADDPWITPWPGNPVHDVVLHACVQAGFQPRVDSLSDDFRAVSALVANGAGVALVPRTALRGIELGGAVIRPLEGDRPTRRVFAAVRRGSRTHPLVELALAALHEESLDLVRRTGP